MIYMKYSSIITFFITINTNIISIFYLAFIKNNQTAKEDMITKNSETVIVSSAESSSVESKEPEKQESSVVEKEEPAESVTIVSSTGSQTIFAVTGISEKNEISLLAENGDSWVSIEIDGDMVDQALLSSGNSLKASIPEGTKQVNLVIGNAAVTSVMLNNKTIEYAPEAADAVTQKIEFQFSNEE